MKRVPAIVFLFLMFVSCTNQPHSSTAASAQSILNNCPQLAGKPVSIVQFENRYHLYSLERSEAEISGLKHYSSDDLISWNEEPNASFESDVQNISAICVVADNENSSGFGAADFPPLLCYYTTMEANGNHSIQIAFSVDEGTSWSSFGNILLTDSEPANFQQPTVRWNADFNAWLMTVSVGNTIRIYRSGDGIHWNYLDEFGEALHFSGKLENPDFFPMQVDGKQTQKWVLWADMKKDDGSLKTKRYLVGDFDGQKFTPIQLKELFLDYGTDPLDGLFFSDDDQNLAFLWGDGSGAEDEERWNEQSILARKLKLINENEKYFISSSPLSKLDTLMQLSAKIDRMELSAEKPVSDKFEFLQRPFLLELTFDNLRKYAIWHSHTYGVRFFTDDGKSIGIGYNTEEEYYYIDRSNLLEKVDAENKLLSSGAAYSVTSPVNTLKVLFDGNSFQLFACDGQIAMTSFCKEPKAFQKFEIYAEGGDAILKEGALFKFNLKDINEKQ